MNAYVYIRSEPSLYTVGFYDPIGKWHPDSDYNSTTQAAERVRFLNGGAPWVKTVSDSPRLLRQNEALREALSLLVTVCNAYDNGQKLPNAIVHATEKAVAVIAQVEGGGEP